MTVTDNELETIVLEDDSSDIAREVVKSSLPEWFLENYGEYSRYTVFSRVLIDVDGLKPVARRILWTMYRNGVLPNKKHLKAARVGGDTYLFHPHGDASITEAMEKLAQSFRQRVPLIDPYGTVGKHAGDKAAAPRYWEARLTEAAVEMISDIKDGAIPPEEMGRNFDNTADEPFFFPAKWPAGIINGTSGMTIGFSASMFQHNPTEAMNACKAILDNPDLTVDELLEIMPGPDFPTGGVLAGTDGVKEYYSTGFGKVVLRGKYEIEHLSRGKVEINFYELPYDVSAEKIIAKIQDVKNRDKAPGLQGVESAKDFSDKNNGMNLSIITKAGSNYHEVLQELFQKTPLESSYHARQVMIFDGVPVNVSILDSLKHFVQLRWVSNKNKCIFRIGEITKRLNRLRGILAVLVDIDRAIAIIRHADDSAIAKAELVNAFDLNDEQAQYILDMQLKRLTKADSLAIQREVDELEQENRALNERLDNDNVMRAHIKDELDATAKIIGDERRTEILDATLSDLADSKKELRAKTRVASKNQTCSVYVLANGKLVRSATSAPALPIQDKIEVKGNGRLGVVDSTGNAHVVPVSYLPEDVVYDMSDLGIHLPDPQDSLVGIFNPDAKKMGIFIVSAGGSVKVSKMDFGNKDEFPVFKLKDNDSVSFVKQVPLTSKDLVSIVSSDSSLVLFPLATINPTGSKAGGVAGIKVREGHEVVGAGLVDLAQGYSNYRVITYTGHSLKNTSLEDFEQKNRGGVGVRSHSFRKGEEKLQNAVIAVNPTVIIAGSLMDDVAKIALPTLARRDATGIKVTMPVEIGYIEPVEEESEKSENSIETDSE